MGCIESLFGIPESINHMLERGSYFLDVRNASDTIWVDGLLFTLFSDFGVKRKMWLAIKDLYTDISVRVLYDGSLSRAFQVMQGTGQERIFAPCMYINGLPTELDNHSLAIAINGLTVSCPSFADDILLLHLFLLSSKFHGQLLRLQLKVEVRILCGHFW